MRVCRFNDNRLDRRAAAQRAGAVGYVIARSAATKQSRGRVRDLIDATRWLRCARNDGKFLEQFKTKDLTHAHLPL